MGADFDRDGDLVRLNAFVDGELAPADRAAIAARLASDPEFARAHATLARLKASLHERAADASVAVPSPRRPPEWRPAVGWAAAVAVAGCLVAAAIADLTPDGAALPALDPDAAAVVLATLPSRPVLPRLDTAGLKLVGISMNAGDDGPTMVASYLGPRGCKLELRAGPASGDAPVVPGSSRHGWTVDDIAYEIVAHGMPPWRFAFIAEAAELQTRSARMPPRVEQRLREARSSAPPCMG